MYKARLFCFFSDCFVAVLDARSSRLLKVLQAQTELESLRTAADLSNRAHEDQAQRDASAMREQRDLIDALRADEALLRRDLAQTEQERSQKMTELIRLQSQRSDAPIGIAKGFPSVRQIVEDFRSVVQQDLDSLTIGSDSWTATVSATRMGQLLVDAASWLCQCEARFMTQCGQDAERSFLASHRGAQLAFQRFLQDGHRQIFPVASGAATLADAHATDLGLDATVLRRLLESLLPPLVIGYVLQPRIELSAGLSSKHVQYTREKCFVLGGGMAKQGDFVEVIISGLVCDGKPLTPMYVRNLQV
jgi:hypothetical protein